MRATTTITEGRGGGGGGGAPRHPPLVARARRRCSAVTAAAARQQQKSDARAVPPPPLFLEDDEGGEAPSTAPLPPLQRTTPSAAPLVVVPQSPTCTPVDAADPVLASLFRQAEACAPTFVVEKDEKPAAVLRRQPGCQQEQGANGASPAAAEANDETDDTIMLARLSAWRALHGTSHVPRRVHDAADLGEWLWKQRRARRKKELPSWLEQALDALATDWRPTAEASRWHAAYHAARRALEVGVGLGGEGVEEEEEEAGAAVAAFPGGWRAARAFAAAGGGNSSTTTADPLHDLARSWMRQQGELLLASSPGLAPHHGAAATAAERRAMLRRLAALAAAAAGDGGGSSSPALLEVRARRSAVADAAAMAGLNAHERKLERRRRRDAERARLERREKAEADAKEAAEVALARVRAEEARREALMLRGGSGGLYDQL